MVLKADFISHLKPHGIVSLNLGQKQHICQCSNTSNPPTDCKTLDNLLKYLYQFHLITPTMFMGFSED